MCDQWGSSQSLQLYLPHHTSVVTMCGLPSLRSYSSQLVALTNSCVVVTFPTVREEYHWRCSSTTLLPYLVWWSYNQGFLLPSEHGSDSGNLTSGTRKTPIEKQPRIRTVLTEQQLQTLRSVYSNNPRPDALLKEQLCELTGLSPRVIRVWFQNRRCKDKKKAIQAEAARMQSMQPMQQGNKVRHTYLR